ncbi:hypothetical protein VTN00DRAFT_4561 [Thermoascus crustaceus]|uniref:uncharacterized protein n=1 Tax=Thermoascus crustaceus TaxID=5088 RepID=UPI003743541B
MITPLSARVQSKTQVLSQLKQTEQSGQPEVIHNDNSYDEICLKRQSSNTSLQRPTIDEKCSSPQLAKTFLAPWIHNLAGPNIE